MAGIIKAKRALLYPRVSKEEQLMGTSPDEQIRVLRDWARMKGYSVIGVIDNDLGMSGSRYQSRPGMTQCIRIIENGGADILIATKLDRIGRNAQVILSIAERIKKAGGWIETCDGMKFSGGLGQGGDITGQLILTIMSGFAEFERDTIRDRSRSGLLARARQGVQPGRGQRPYGYRIITNTDMLKGNNVVEGVAKRAGEYVIVEKEAEYVRQIYSRYVSGQTLSNLSEWLHASGVRTCTNRDYWSPPTLIAIMRNPVYKGTAHYNRVTNRNVENKYGELKRTREEKDESEWITIMAPRTVSDELWARANAILSEARELRSGRPQKAYLLTGLLRCPHCGRRMIGIHKDRARKAWYYRCALMTKSGAAQCHKPICEGVRVHGRAMDESVINMLTIFGGAPELLEDAARRALANGYGEYDAVRYATLRKNMDAVEIKERTIIDMQVRQVSAGRDASAYDTMLDEVDTERKLMKAEMAVLENAKGLVSSQNIANFARVQSTILVDARENLISDVLTLSEKWALLTTIIERITVFGDHIEVIFRGGCTNTLNVALVTLRVLVQNKTLEAWAGSPCIFTGI